MGPLSGSGKMEGKPAGEGKKRQLPRRESPIDALLISAVLAGSGPLTRHHLGHGPARPGAYASCDESRPASPSREPIPSKVVMRSLQAPRSERLRIDRENEERQHAVPTDEKLGQSSTPPGGRRASSERKLDDLSSRTSRLSFSSKDRPKRRMSIDPAPVSQLLQAASPQTNFFAQPIAPFVQPGSSSQLAQPVRRASTARPQVRCMARTRIPTPHGELFLHLYHNDVDSKEHLAVVIDPIQLSEEEKRAAPAGRREIRSKSLNAKWREGETDMERVVRGAYVGRLLPGGEGQASQPPSDRPGRIDEEIEEESEAAKVEMKDILPLVRIHSECFTGETIGSMRCDCGEQLDEALRLIATPQYVSSKSSTDAETTTMADTRPPSPSSSHSQSTVPGRGVVIYMRQEGRGIGLLEKIRAYNLQDLGHDTVTANLMLGHGADERKYDVAAEILRDLGLARPGGEGIRLLTNNPEKVEGLATEGVRVVERVGMVPRDWVCRDSLGPAISGEKDYAEWRERRAGVGLIGAGKAAGPELEKYLRTKVERMGHMIDIPEQERGSS